MYRVVNIPRDGNPRAVLTASVENQTVYVKVVDKEIPPPFNHTGVCDMYIGDHMFEKPDDLRMMVGRALVTAITQARDAGYQQAMADVRSVLGIHK